MSRFAKLIFLFLFCCNSAWAVIPKVLDRPAACETARALRQTQWSSGDVLISSCSTSSNVVYLNLWRRGPPPSLASSDEPNLTYPVLACPANSTGSSSCTCNSGYVENSTATACVEVVNPCIATQGQTRSVNVTIGWSQSSDSIYSVANTAGSGVSIPASIAVDGCMWDAVDYGLSDSGWISSVPSANGLYRMSQDKSYRQTAVQASGGGTSADNSPSLVNPTEAPPVCPGSVGEINGVTRCVTPTNANVVKAIPTGIPSVVNPGNPAAGLKPSTGEGSGSDGAGRTPSTGSGTSAGGPAAASSGTPLYTGKLPSTPGEQAACGAPGQPVCDVKLSETGTPTAADDKYDAKAAAIKDSMDAGLSRMAGGSDTGGFFGSWNVFFSAPAVVACSAYALPEFLGISMGSIDPCPVVDGVRTIMGYLWALAGLFLCLGFVRETVQKG